MTAAARDEGDSQAVRGERSTALASAAHSAQSRLASLLAAALMVALGVSALTWYYAHVFSRQSRTRQATQSSAASHAQGEMALPALGRIEPPVSTAASVSRSGSGTCDRPSGSAWPR